MNAFEAYRRGRALQAAILREGGPGPENAREFAQDVGVLDAFQVEQEQGELGFFPILTLLGALAGLAAVFATVHIVRGLPTLTEQTRRALKTGTTIGLWALGLWAGIALYQQARR